MPIIHGAIQLIRISQPMLMPWTHSLPSAVSLLRKYDPKETHQEGFPQ